MHPSLQQLQAELLLSDSIGSAKTQKAVKDAIPVVTEQWLRQSIAAGKPSIDASLFLSGGGASGAGASASASAAPSKSASANTAHSKAKHAKDQEDDEEDGSMEEEDARAKKRKSSSKSTGKRKAADDEEKDEKKADDAQSSSSSSGGGIGDFIKGIFGGGSSAKKARTSTSTSTSAKGFDVELVLSFDTTGSMSSVLLEVRKQLKHLLKRMFSEVADIRIAVV